MPPETKQDPTASFRESLKDLIIIVEKLAPYCQSLEDLVGVASLALENDGQAKMIMMLVAGKR